MKKIIFALSLVFLASCVGKSPKPVEEVGTAIDSIALKTEADAAHNAKNSLDVNGVYMGELPLASKGALKVTITIDGASYTCKKVYPVAGAKVEEMAGKVLWNDAGNTITLDGITAPNQYFVGENQLIQLDMEGKKIEGDLAAKYVLAKQ